MNVETIQASFEKFRAQPGDINQHMDRLLELARECDHVVEGGVRYVISTWAFLLGCACRGGTVVSYDWIPTDHSEAAEKTCLDAGVPWDFRKADWLHVEIPETDLLFIDTCHTYKQLTEEFRLHAPKAKKYIVLHDTVLFGLEGEDGTKPGLWQAVEDFVALGEWKIHEHLTNQCGLTTLIRSHS